jgi:alkane 1-monooxygenase
MLIKLVNPSARTMVRIRAIAFFLPATLPFSLYAAAQLGQATGEPNWSAFLPLFLIYGLMTILDYIVGRDETNLAPNESAAADQISAFFYRALVFLTLPLQLAMLYFAGQYFVETPLNIIGQLGWLLSVGTIGGVLAINAGHELVHKPTSSEQITGGLLLATVCYGSFKTEHVYGHHAWVSTPRDHSSAPRGANVYTFVPDSIFHNVLGGFTLEAQRLARRGFKAFSWRNELIWWTLISGGLTAFFGWQFGVMGLVFFLAQSLIAIVHLEIINYIEHYGLSRNLEASGRYEKVTPMHSWNSSYFFTNAFLFQLQRHSDHHANAARRYQDLRHHDGAPQLPGGYGAMLLLALVPPLWWMVIHPRLDAQGTQ